MCEKVQCPIKGLKSFIRNLDSIYIREKKKEKKKKNKKEKWTYKQTSEITEMF